MLHNLRDNLSKIQLFSFCFFLPGFFSQRLTIHRAAGEGRGPSFIPLYHFHPLTNIETFICNFACEMTITIFNRNVCVYQTATRWDLPPYRITIWLIDWWCNVCLFTWWIGTRFCYIDLTLETDWFELASTITLVFASVLVTSKMKMYLSVSKDENDIKLTSVTFLISSWHSDVVTTLEQPLCWRCRNIVARPKMRIVPRSVSDNVTMSLSDIIKALLQRRQNNKHWISRPFYYGLFCFLSLHRSVGELQKC